MENGPAMRVSRPAARQKWVSPITANRNDIALVLHSNGHTISAFLAKIKSPIPFAAEKCPLRTASHSNGDDAGEYSGQTDAGGQVESFPQHEKAVQEETGNTRSHGDRITDRPRAARRHPVQTVIEEEEKRHDIDQRQRQQQRQSAARPDARPGQKEVHRKRCQNTELHEKRPSRTAHPGKVKIVVDNSIAGSSNLVVGANEPDYHYKNFNFERDFARHGEVIVADIATVRAGDPCVLDGTPLQMVRGIEIGNIFQLGTRYSEAMNCCYLDENGKSHPMVMGCYGIGVGRAMAAVIEQANDQYGPIWPMSIAPYQVEIVSLTPERDDCGAVSETLYTELSKRGVEVLWDDRGEKAGFMFSDADLMGIPLRIVVSPKTLADGEVEFKIRGEKESVRVKLDEICDFVEVKIAEKLAELEP